MEDSGEKWGVNMLLMGEFHHTIDEKKRLIIPAKFRNELGDTFVITRGIEKCLYVYSLNEFESIANKLKEIPFTKKDARSFTRFFLSGATTVEFDKQGRITIPTPLTDYASISKDCVVVGTGDRLEVWDSTSWNDVYLSTKDNMSDIAETLFDTNI